MPDDWKTVDPVDPGDWQSVDGQQERTLAGFGSNILKSGSEFVSGAVKAVTQPMQTLEGIGGVVLGAAEKLIPGEQRDEKFVDAITKFYGDRYGSLEGFKKAAYEDPVGVIADFSTALGGAGAVLKGVGAGAKASGMAKVASQAGKAARVAETAAAVTDPVGVAAGAARQTARLVPAGQATRLYESALKLPPRSISPADRAKIVETGLREQIPVSQGGVQKLSDLIDSLNSEIKTRIDDGAGRGITVSPSAVEKRLDDTRATFSKQVDPKADLGTIDRTAARWMKEHSTEVVTPAAPPTPKQAFLGQSNQPTTTRVDTPIPADKAQAIKQGTYKQLKDRAYKGGDVKPAEVEAQKALARGIKEELAAQIPEIAGLNARESSAIALNKELESAVARIGNHQLFGIGTPIAAGGIKAMTGSDAAAAIGGVMRMIVEDPRVKSRIAIAMRQAKITGKAPLEASKLTTAERLNAYLDSLKSQDPIESTGQLSGVPAR